MQHTKLGITLADVTQELYRTSTYVFSPKFPQFFLHWKW